MSAYAIRGGTGLAAARDEANDAGWSNVEFQAANVTEWASLGAFDVVYGRFILSHLDRRPAMMAAMRAALRPGGMLILEDIDFTGAFCHPPNAAFQRYCELYRAVIGRRGGDADLGPQLYGLCLDAGLHDVTVRVVQPLHSGAEPDKTLMLSTLINIGDAVLAEGLATSSDLEATIAALASYTDDPRSMISLPRVFQVWGRTPVA